MALHGDIAAASLLASLQLADSFFPSGLFTQSHGLERFVEQGLHGEAALVSLLESYVVHVAAPGDALAARWVARAAAEDNRDLITAIDQRLEATKLAHEGRLASRRCGGRLLQLGCSVFGGALLDHYAGQVRTGQAPGHQAVAQALIAHAAGLDEQSTVLVELHCFSVSLVSAALRLGAIEHAAAQRLLLRLRPTIAHAAMIGAHRNWDELGSFAPQIELMQFQHAGAEQHLFVS